MDRRIHGYLRQFMARERDCERVGPFLVGLSSANANPYVNYAVPDDDASPGTAEVAALVEAFVRHRRQPRLEYLPSAAPDVVGPLTAAGFVVEARLPVMVCVPHRLRTASAPESIDLLAPATDDEIDSLVTAPHDAFGAAPPTAKIVAAVKRSLDGPTSAV